MIRFLIFDHDMTIVDSSRALTDAVNSVAKELGKPNVTREETMRYVALPLSEFFVGIWGECRDEWIDLYRDRAERLEHEAIRPFAEVPGTLTRLREMGAILAVASNRHDPRRAMDKSRTSRYFDAIVGPIDGFAFKPDPGMLNSLMDRFGVPARETVYVGDSDLDVRTGQAAGVRVVSVTTGNFSREELLDLGAWRVIDAMDELIPVVCADASAKAPGSDGGQGDTGGKDVGN